MKKYVLFFMMALLLVMMVSGFSECTDTGCTEFTVDEDIADENSASDDSTVIESYTFGEKNEPEIPEESDEPVCTVNSMDADPGIIKALGDVSENDWIFGPDDAIMTITEYADFQCKYCSEAGPDLFTFQREHPDEVRIVFRHYPLDEHTKALPAAYMAEAAGKQGKFFEMAEFLMDNRDTWVDIDDSKFFEWVIDNADFIDDIDQFTQDYADEAMHTRIQNEKQKAFESGYISATPTYFLNMNSYRNNFNKYNLNEWLKVLRLKDRVFTECPSFEIDTDKDYKAVIETTQGTVEVELYDDQAPLAVSNFIFLAENGWFTDMPMTAVIDGFAVQFGDPSATGMMNAGYTFKVEKPEVEYQNGYLAMLSSDEVKNSSSMIITLNMEKYYRNSIAYGNDQLEDDQKTTEEFMDGYAIDSANEILKKYTVFGKVTDETYDVVKRLYLNDKILSVTIM